MELEASELPVDERKTPAQEPQEPAGAPLPEPEQEDPTPVAEEPEERVLVTYGEAADALDVAPETVRGWKAQGKITSYPGQGANSVLVDLRECQSVKARRPVGV
jgi:hypothetical protein